MKKKSFSILLIIMLMMSMLIGLTACNDEDDDTDDDNKIGSSEKTIENYIDAINDRDVDAILKMVNIKEMNQFAEDAFESDTKITKSRLKSNWKEYFEIAEDYDISLKLTSDIYEISSKTDFKKAYKKMDGWDEWGDADSQWESVEDFVDAGYTFYLFTVKWSDEEEDVDRVIMMSLNDDNEIINDSIVYYYFYSY